MGAQSELSLLMADKRGAKSATSLGKLTRVRSKPSFTDAVFDRNILQAGTYLHRTVSETGNGRGPELQCSSEPRRPSPLPGPGGMQRMTS